LTKVVAGTPDHWDMYLTPEEQAKGDAIMVCCSRSQTARLVLDL
jgi:vanillate O-demethylase ferredoxin subunit